MKSVLGKRKFPFSRISDGDSGGFTPSNIECLLNEAIAKVPAKALDTLPAVVFRHQLYNQGHSRTWVDQQIGKLQNEGRVTLLKLHVKSDALSVAVVMTSHLARHIKRATSSRTIAHYVDDVLPFLRDVCVEKSFLKTKFKLSDCALKELVQEGVLVLGDVGRYWVSFPGAGEFVKIYTTGRNHLIRTLRKAKYSEILETELLKRHIPKKAVLGMEYHICDLIGSEDVKCVKTTSGTALRIQQE